MKHNIYVVSKIRHVSLWHKLREEGYPIISTWIDDGPEGDMDFSVSWSRYLVEASSAAFVLVYTEPGEILKGGICEIGAALGGGARVFIIGDIPEALRTVQYHPSVVKVESIAHALHQIRALSGIGPWISSQETQVGQWVESRFGIGYLFNMRERGHRVLEEAIELGQSLGVTKREVRALANHVYAKPPGEPAKEIAHVEVTLLATAYAWGVSLTDETDKEIKRIQGLSVEHFQARQAAKVAAGVGVPPVNGTPQTLPAN